MHMTKNCLQLELYPSSVKLYQSLPNYNVASCNFVSDSNTQFGSLISDTDSLPGWPCGSVSAYARGRISAELEILIELLI